MLETIKEYLVSLGFKTDNSSLNAAHNAMKSAESSVDSFANSSVKNFAKATTAVVSFVATANIALGKYLVSLAQSDLQTEMFARKMWMSKDAAKAYQASIDALGVSVNDLYLSPELMDKYLELNRQARDMAVPTDEYNKQMRSVRDITFEFQRLKLEGTYALQWIGYYLTKFLAGPLGDSRDWLRKINDEIEQKMPEWTKKVAEVASWFVRLGKAAWDIRGALGAVLGILVGFKMISVLTNPLGLLILGLTTLLLLVDDFNTYKDGGESAFPKLWEWVEKFKKSLEDNGTIEDFKKDIKDIIKDVREFGETLERISRSETAQKLIKNIKDIFFKLGEIIQGTGIWLADFYKTIKDNGDLEKFGKDVGDLADSFLELVSAIETLMIKLGKGGVGDAIKHNLINMLEIVDGLVKSIAGGLQIITAILENDKEKSKEGVENIVGGILDAFIGRENTKKAKDKIQELDDNISKSDFWSKFLGSLGWRNRADSSSQGPKAGQISYEKPTANWSSFKNSIPGANTDASTVDWNALKKGFVAFMNSIPKEFGEISKGLFQNINGDSGAIAGIGAMSYLYPQSTTSNMSQVSLKQTYNIYGAKDPQSVATTVTRTSTSALTRWGQGVNR